jgi:hypothetical protein
MGAPHSVQLFDSHDSAAAALAEFVRTGFANGEQIVLVTRLGDWNRAAVDLARELPLGEAISSGQLTVCDSSRTLGTLLVDGMPSAERFESLVGGLISRCAARGTALRAYGDMVDLLAADGRFEAAERLEELWNNLRTRVPFALFCGYSSGHFCDAASGEALRRIRHLHSHETCASSDFMANELMETDARS